MGYHVAFNRLKAFRGIATRYDRPCNYLASVCLAAALVCQSHAEAKSYALVVPLVGRDSAPALSLPIFCDGK
jgi:hypothetical protein